MRTRRRIGAAALAALLLGAAAPACSSGSQGADGPSDADPGAEVHPLADRTFVSTGVTEDGAPRPLAAGSRVTLVFDEGELRAEAGCNSLRGDLVIDGDRLVVPTMGGTERGCPTELMAQDEWLVGLLTASPTWRIDGDELVITSGSTTIELVDEEVAVPDAPLVGTTWHLETIVAGETASSVPAGVQAHIVFETDGQAVGSNGCNGFGGPYTTTASSVTFGLIAQTLVGCDDSKATVEQKVMAVLTGEVAYEIDGDALRLTAASGDALAFRARA